MFDRIALYLQDAHDLRGSGHRQVRRRKALKLFGRLKADWFGTQLFRWQPTLL